MDPEAYSRYMLGTDLAGFLVCDFGVVVSYNQLGH